MKKKINNTKGSFILLIFRLSNFFSGKLSLRILGFPVRVFYKVVIEWILGVEVPDTTVIGRNFIILHGQGLVINSNTIIGDNVIVRQNTTIGNARSGGESPKIGDNVNIGANCVIIGDIEIGDNSIIGAGSVVVKDVPKNSLVVGNPAKVVK